MQHARIFAAEFFGTMLLLIVGVSILFSRGGDATGIALMLGFTVIVISALFGPASGAHLNPAVTLGMAAARKVDHDKVPTYLVAQFLGGLVGALLSFWIARGQDGGFSPGEDNFSISGWENVSGYDWVSMIIAVTLFTGLLVAVYVATAARGVAGHLRAIAAGLAYAVVTYAGLGVIGISVNPALSFGSAVFAGGDAFSAVWLIMLFNVVGAVVGVLLWLSVDESSLEDTMMGDSALARRARDVADAAVDRTAGAVSTAAGKVSDTVENVVDKVEDAADSAKDKITRDDD